VARHLSTAARFFERRLQPAGQVTIMAISLELSQFALLLGDPDIQRLSARIDRTVRPDDLAPRPRGRHLAAPCGTSASGQPFDGRLTGMVTVGTTPFDVDVVVEKRRKGYRFL
jgi:hypothetical protein